MVTKTIESLNVHYENLLVKFKGDPKHYFLSLNTLIGQRIKGRIVQKRVRTWFEVGRGESNVEMRKVRKKENTR